MTDYKKFFAQLLNLPMKLLMSSKVILDDLDLELGSKKQPIFYVIKHDSLSDLMALKTACKKSNLPDPFKPVKVNDKLFRRYVCLDKLQPVLAKESGKTDATEQIQTVLQQHEQQADLDAKLVPCFISWGRSPGKETSNIKKLFNHQEKPSWLRKIFTVLFIGRDNFVSVSQPLSLRFVVDQYGSSPEIARKMLRVARFHFQRQQLTMAGPRLWQRDHLLTSLLASPSIKDAINDEAKSKNISHEKAKEQAKNYLNEIAADYRDSWIRIGETILTWIWNKLYSGIEVKNGEKVRKLAQDGHEIIYMSCHRSHMDYLLLTYVIYHQGLVPPHIAAGVNLNFWPMGGIFRRSGAFFMRRSFRGNKLYSEVFREYLSQLISKGHSIKFYPESGRSRTGRLLKPKTGMLAMVIQNMLKGQDRPVTIVPVYIGYEHVMEVKTYLRELGGQKKKKESALHLFSIIKNLRHFGRGYVNFGEPISVNKTMESYQPNWKQQLEHNHKPTWLPSYINSLSHNVMCNINHAAALNGVTLTAMSLSVANQNTLFKDDLIKQLKICLALHQKNTPFGNLSMPPEDSTEALINNAIKMEKFTEDTDGQNTVSISQDSIVELNYYRNNILHLYIIPSLIAAFLLESDNIEKTDLITNIHKLYPIVANEYFLKIEQTELIKHIDACLDVFSENNLVKLKDNKLTSVKPAHPEYLQLHLLSLVAQQTLQRYAIVLHSIESHEEGLSRSALERHSLEVAKNLATLHDIKSPAFTDKSILSQFVGELKEQALIVIHQEGRFVATLELKELSEKIYRLIDGDILNTIRHA